MNTGERIFKISIYLIQILFFTSMLFVAEYGFYLVLLFLFLSFLIKAISLLFYYFYLAHFMVGGKRLLFRGILYLDASLLLLNAPIIPDQILSLYMAAILAYNAIVQLLNTINRKKTGSRAWKLSLIHCVLIASGAILCIVFMNDHITVLYITAFNYIYSAAVKLSNTLRSSSVIFVQ